MVVLVSSTFISHTCHAMNEPIARSACVVAKHLEEQEVCSHITVYRFLKGIGTTSRKDAKAGELSGNIKLNVLQAVLDYLELTVRRA